MRIQSRFALLLFVVGTLCALVPGSATQAARPPRYDVTGAWAGSVVIEGGETIGLTGTLTAGRNRRFTAELDTDEAEPSHGTGKGTISASGNVSLQMRFGTSKVTFNGKLNQMTNTISGRIRGRDPEDGRFRGTFTLTKS
jgi:hypothetical protein